MILQETCKLRTNFAVTLRYMWRLIPGRRESSWIKNYANRSLDARALQKRLKLAISSELNGEPASGCPRARAPVNPDASSSPYTYKRQLPAVGLLPSGPEPVPAIMVHKPSFRKTHGPVLSLQDGESLSATGLNAQRPKSSVSFAPRLSTISGYR